MSYPRTKGEFRRCLDISMGVLPQPLYQRQRKVYLLAICAGYASGYSRAEMTYAREFLCCIRRMRLPR